MSLSYLSQYSPCLTNHNIVFHNITDHCILNHVVSNKNVLRKHADGLNNARFVGSPY